MYSLDGFSVKMAILIEIAFIPTIFVYQFAIVDVIFVNSFML